MYNTIIFDVDGTLLDSSEGIINAVKYTIKQHGLRNLSDLELREFIGYSPLQNAFMHFCLIDENIAQYRPDTILKLNTDKINSFDWQTKIGLKEMIQKTISSYVEERNSCEK